jgi:hypothetical protein
MRREVTRQHFSTDICFAMSYAEDDGEKLSERSRWPPLARLLMSGEIGTEEPQILAPKDKFGRWMVNEGYRRL